MNNSAGSNNREKARQRRHGGLVDGYFTDAAQHRPQCQNKCGYASLIDSVKLYVFHVFWFDMVIKLISRDRNPACFFYNSSSSIPKRFSRSCFFILCITPFLVAPVFQL